MNQAIHPNRFHAFKLIVVLMLAGPPLPLFGQPTITPHYALDWLRWGASGPSSHHATSTAYASDGSIYMTGHFLESIIFGISFPPSPGLVASTQKNDMFMVKYNPDGTFAWARSLEVAEISPNNNTVCSSGVEIAVDSHDAVYAIGRAYCGLDVDGPASTGQGGEIPASPATSVIPYDILQTYFIVKYDASGNVAWARHASGHTTRFNDIAIGLNDQVFVTGTFETHLDLDGPTQTGMGGELFEEPENDLTFFVASYSSTGDFLWVRSHAQLSNVDSFGSEGYGVTVDGNGNAIITGLFEGSVDFDGHTINGMGGELTTNDGQNMLFAKYAANGDFQWVTHGTYLGAPLNLLIDTDAAGNIYSAGYTLDLVSLDFDGPAIVGQGGETSLIEEGDFIAYLAKHSPTGAFEWMIEIQGQGSGDAYINALKTSHAGNVFITGAFNGHTDFDGPNVVGQGGEILKISDIHQLYIANYGTGGALHWVKTESQPGHFAEPAGIDLSPEEKVVVGGVYKRELHIEQSSIFSASTPNHAYNSFLFQLEQKMIVAPSPLKEFPIEEEFHVYIPPHILVSEVYDSRGEEIDIDGVYITHVTSDEPLLSEEDETDDDILADGCYNVGLRHEAMRSGNGRVYTIHLALQDQYGVIGTEQVEVHVPLEGEEWAVNDGVKYTQELCPDGEASLRSWTRARDNAFTLQEKSSPNAPMLTAYPNPFNPQTTITLSVPDRQEVRVSVYDMLGRRIALLYHGAMQGTQSVTFDASSLPSGGYFIRAQGDNFTKSRHIVLAK